ncbi:MAG: LacI family transcriptional regulator [Clostridia bacterium]|nr:LacI family transcriptional regulator [Clostridia bacterium]
MIHKYENDNKKEVTIYDLANITGFSPGTISRCLNNIGYIKEDTRKRIETACEQLNYMPNRVARSLKTKKTELILVAIPDMDNPFFVDMIKAIDEVAKSHAYSIILYYTKGDLNEELKVLNMMKEHIADAMIMINLNFTHKHVKAITHIYSPIVLSGICSSKINKNTIDCCDYVGVDTYKGTYEATKHLILQGYKRIGFISGPKSISVFYERYCGYRDAMLASGIKVNKENIIFKEAWGEEAGYEAAYTLLKNNILPQALCTSNDIMAVGAIMALKEMKLNIPRDIAIIGMDNIELGRRLSPALSTVSIAQYEIGKAAANIIFDKLSGIQNKSFENIIYEPRLIIRESSINKKVDRNYG